MARWQIVVKTSEATKQTKMFISMLALSVITSPCLLALCSFVRVQRMPKTSQPLKMCFTKATCVSSTSVPFVPSYSLVNRTGFPQNDAGGGVGRGAHDVALS